MLYCDRFDVSEVTDVNKTSALSVMFVNYYFLYFSFKFQLNVSNRFHRLLMISVDLSDIAVLNIKGSNYHCIFSLI